MPEASVVKISHATIQRRAGRVELAWRVDGLNQRELRFTVASGYEGFLDDGYEAAVVALLIPAMQVGKNIEVDGPLSGRLLWGLSRGVIPILRTQMPELSRIEVIPVGERSTVQRVERAVATGLSNGVDSLTTCLDHLSDPSVPTSLRVTHFLFNDVGSHGDSGNTESLRDRRLAGVSATAEELGVPLIYVESNVSDFYSLPFLATHTLLNVAVPMALQRGVRRFLYSSGSDFGEISVRSIADIGLADPLLLQFLSTEWLDLVPVGNEYTRVEKVLKIADFELATRRLDVCLRSGHNCGICRKCVQVLLILEANDTLERFEHLFDLDAYRRVRSRNVSWIVASDDISAIHTVDFLREQRRGPTPVEHAFALFIRVFTRVQNWLRRVLPAQAARLIERVSRTLRRRILR